MNGNDFDEELKTDEISQWVKRVYEGELFLGKLLAKTTEKDLVIYYDKMYNK